MMTCAEVRDRLFEAVRGELPAELAAAIRGHAEGCRECAAALAEEAHLRLLVRTRAPRYQAPPELRARVMALTAPAPPRRWFEGASWLRGHPWRLRGLTAATAMLAVAAGLLLFRPTDPTTSLMARAVSEHAEYVRETMPKPAPESGPLLASLQAGLPYAVEPVFRGDDDVRLVATVKGELSATTACLVYRSATGRYSSLFLMPGAGTPIPAEGRLAIESFTPHHRVVAGRQLLLWKQRDLAYLLVSDLDAADLPAMFLKIRRAG
jgi:anti-sigma factor (TIGR02949 family)